MTPDTAPNGDQDRITDSAACVCGHASAHHTKRDSVYAGLMADYRVVWRCSWKGCGCPEFIAQPQEAKS